jgi:hypothetical protein
VRLAPPVHVVAKQGRAHLQGHGDGRHNSGHHTVSSALFGIPKIGMGSDGNANGEPQ